MPQNLLRRIVGKATKHGISLLLFDFQHHNSKFVILSASIILFSFAACLR